MTEIENGILSAKVDERGSQLVSVSSIKTGREYIWGADPKIWGRSAPILFPAVGRMYTDGYIYKGKRYRMSKHGFLRDEMLSVKENKGDAVSFIYRQTEKIKEIYPFDFTFETSFSLSGNTLVTEYTVENNGDETMFFSLGAHPGFSCNMGDKVTFSEREAEKAPYFDKDDRPSGKEFAELSEGKSFYITDDIFFEGSIVFSSPNSKSVSLSENEEEYMRIEFGKVPHLWIWAKQGAKFICIEPWHGADECVPQEDISKKSGIISLLPKERFSFPIKMVFPKEI